MNDIILLGRVLSDVTRVRILAALRGGELCVCELVDALEISQSTLSSHLQVIRQAGLVITRKQGRWIYYTLEPAKAALLETVFEHHAKTLAADKLVLGDARRLKNRLCFREQGVCVVSTVVRRGAKQTK